MEEIKTTQPSLDTWDKLPSEEIEKKPKVSFDVNIPIVATFKTDEPRSYSGETGAFFVFDVEVDGEEKAIVTSAWTLLRALKVNSPLKDKTLKITKKLIKGKQQFEVEA